MTQLPRKGNAYKIVYIYNYIKYLFVSLDATPALASVRGMTATSLTLQHERIDDLPLLWGVLLSLRLPELLQRYLGNHHLHQGLPNGTLATLWIAVILSEANHCKVTVQDWALRHQHLLETLLQQPVRPVDFTDDRLAIVLHRFHNADWEGLEQQLWDQTCEVYDIPMIGVRLDATTSFGYHEVNSDGLLQFGHSKDHRPDLPQLKLMAAVAQPSSHTLAGNIVPGNTADDGLYLPMIARVRRQLRRTGLLYLGDCKMAALATRAEIAQHKDYYLTVLPRTGDTAKAIDEWIDQAVTGQQPLQKFYRTNKKNKRVLLARGYEFVRGCRGRVDGVDVVWDERVQLLCTEALAQDRGERLERRLQEAEAALRTLTPPVGRGHRQHREEESLRQAVTGTLAEYDVAGLLSVSWRSESYGTKVVSGASQEKKVRYVITEVCRNDTAIALAKERYGWRVQVTNMPKKKCDLENALLLYNGGWSVERPFHVLKDKPLGIQPLYVREEDQVDGLTKLLMIALRVLTLIEVEVRGRLAERQETLTGLYEGQPKRTTATPTAVRLLRAVSRMEITATQVVWDEGTSWKLTSLPPLLVRILSLLNLQAELYTQLATAE
jgi:transposase